MLRSPSSQKDKTKEREIISPIRPLFGNRLVSINSESSDNFRYSNLQKVQSLDMDSGQSGDRGRGRSCSRSAVMSQVILILLPKDEAILLQVVLAVHLAQ